MEAKNFLNIIRLTIIPSLEYMIGEEHKHQKFLQNAEDAGFNVTKFKQHSNECLAAYQQRLREYQTYLKDNLNDYV